MIRSVHCFLVLTLISVFSTGPAEALEKLQLTVTSELVPSPVEYALLAPTGFQNMEDLPLVLNLHGGGGSRQRLLAQADMWQQLWDSGAIPPAIVVMPSVTARGFYMNFRDGSERWEDFLTGPFLAHLRESFPVTGNPKRIFLTGASMGGMGALRMAFKHPDKFGAVAALEPGIEPILKYEDMQAKHRFWRSDELIEQAFGKPVDDAYWQANNPASIAQHSADLLRNSELQIYLEAGDMDQFWLYEGAEFLHQILWQERIRHEYHLVRGADHVGPSMRERMDEAVRFLFRYHNPWPTTPRMEAVDRMLDPLKERITAQDHYNEGLPDHYAESAMISLLSEDGQVDLSLRLARFPQRNEAHVWFHAAVEKGAWSVVDERLTSHNSMATKVAADSASFVASNAGQSVEFSSTHRDGLLQGRVNARFNVNPTRHPEAGPGSLPVELDLRFLANSAGDRSSSGRLELAGHIQGQVNIAGRSWSIDEAGKWHEQTGPRENFAPAFTYLNLQNSEASILAIGFRDRVAGSALVDGVRSPVSEFKIDPEGQQVRQFTLTLADGRHVNGAARAVQVWSVPIEGIRRPGSSVLVESNIGAFRGSLNDWMPADR